MCLIDFYLWQAQERHRLRLDMEALDAGNLLFLEVEAARNAAIPEKVRRRRMAQRAIARERAAVIARDGWLCGICEEWVTPDTLSIDHRIPIILGGSDDRENLQVAHRSCNSRKGARNAA